MPLYKHEIVFVCPSCQTKNDILAWLKQWGPAYLGELAERLVMDRSTLAYHLGELEREKFLTSKYEIIKEPTKLQKGKAVRVYSILERESSNRPKSEER